MQNIEEKLEELKGLLKTEIDLQRKERHPNFYPLKVLYASLWKVYEWLGFFIDSNNKPIETIDEQTFITAGRNSSGGGKNDADWLAECENEVFGYLKETISKSELIFDLMVDKDCDQSGKSNERVIVKLARKVNSSNNRNDVTQSELNYERCILAIESLRAGLTSIHVRSRRYSLTCNRDQVNELRSIIEILKEPLGNLLKYYLSAWTDEDGLHLTSNWLKGWFFLNILDSETLKIYMKNEPSNQVFSKEEVLLFCRHFATVGLHILHWLRNEGNELRFRFSDVQGGSEEHREAFLYLLTEFAHVEYDLKRRSRLFFTLKTIWAHEAILFTIRDTYRDHINHVLDTCLLGLFLLKMEKSARNDDKVFPISQDQSPSSKSNQKHQKKTYRNWIITSLMHDVGYAATIIRKASDKLSFMDSDPVREFLQELSSHLDSNFASLQSKLEQLLQDITGEDGHSFDLLDHGVLSALHIQWLVRNNEEPDPDWFEDMKTAMDASARHNIKGLPISFRTHPLAFLLILCDHLQEWDRPVIMGEEINPVLAIAIAGKEWRPLDMGSMVEYMTIKGVKLKIESNSPTFELKKKDPLHFTLHFAVARGDYHPSLTWLQTSNDLRSIVDSPRKIRITMSHPPQTLQSEMDLFQSFCRSQENLTGLYDWVISARSPNGWYRYHTEDQNDHSFKEMFKFDFQPQREAILNSNIPLIPEGTRQQFTKWKASRLGK
jgi:hypothetical protein